MKMQAEAEKHLTSRIIKQNQPQTSGELLSEEMFESSSSQCDKGGAPKRKKTTTDNSLSKTESPLNTMKKLMDAKEEITTEPQRLNSVASNSHPLTKQVTNNPPKTNLTSKKSTMAELEEELDALLKLWCF